MRFRLLGPLEVDDVQDAAVLRRAKPRALLAMLLLEANRPVSTRRLVEGLWGDEEPASALGALQNYVSQLRKALGRDAVATRPPGYAILVEAGELDLHVFERLVGEAAELEGSERAERLRQALALWRGPPLADVADEPFAGPEIKRLEELRQAATEQRVAVDLELGRHHELMAELEGLIRDHPRSERLRALHMLALYRAGRQADALAAYRAARRTLVEEHGLEPGEELQRLERAILTHDPAVAAPAPRAPAAAPKPVPSIPAGRRTVTVLFADVGGSTALGEALDPEALRGLMSSFFTEMRTTIERHGGTVEKVSGDEVMAVFGAPTAHEDDALRALRAADEMQAAVAAVDETLERERGVRFRLRVGVNTGEVVAGEAAAGGTFVTGPAVNLGKRLQEIAEPGQIVFGAATLKLVRDAVDVEPLGAVELRGARDTVEAYRLLRVDPRAAGVARALDAPLVGRTDELDGLRKTFEAVRAERTCRFVALVGDAGIGKTRLARELVASVEADARVLVGRCVPYGDGATYLPLVDALGDVREELDELLVPEEDRELVEARITALFGGEATPAASGETAWALRRVLELLSRERPVVLVFDDVHWGEPTFLDLLEYVRAWTASAPVLLLALTRPDVLDQRPTWADPASGVEVVRVEPLRDAETRSLVENLAETVEDALLERVTQLAEGYPLFAEQLVAYVEESGGDVDLDAMPATIETLLSSRLDRLDADERAVLERASVVGREFWRGAVLALTPERELAAVNRHLMSLVRRGLVRPARSDLPREDALRFHHALVRDVAYAGIRKSVRADLHERAADWLEQRAGEPDEVVGYHLEQAHRYRTELGPGDRTVRRLGAEAGERLGRAGVRALARGDSPAAVNLLDRATYLLHAADSLRLELLCELGVAYRMAGDLQRADRVLVDAAAGAASARDRRLELRARLELAGVRIHIHPEGRSAEILTLVDAGVPVFEALGDDRALGRAWFMHAFVRGGFHLQNAEMEASAERALVHYRRAGWPTSTCVQAITSALFYGPRPATEGLARCARLEDSEVSDRAGAAHVRVWRAGLFAMQGRLDEARADLASARETYLELGQAVSAAVSCDAVGSFIEFSAGDYAAAARILRSSATFFQERGEFANLATRAAELAHALFAEGDYDEAEEWGGIAQKHSASDDVSAEFTWRSARAKILAQAGAIDEAETLAREAVELVDRTDALNQRADVRLDLARVLAFRAQHSQAREVANEAAMLFDKKENVVGAATARRVGDMVRQVRTAGEPAA